MHMVDGEHGHCHGHEHDHEHCHEHTHDHSQEVPRDRKGRCGGTD